MTRELPRKQLYSVANHANTLLTETLKDAANFLDYYDASSDFSKEFVDSRIPETTRTDKTETFPALPTA